MAAKPLKCLVEIPKGSRNKYEYDHDEDCIKLDRFLFSSMVYPTDYGFIPDTLGLDGDPLDAMVCVSEATFPGCMIYVKPIALFRMEDDKGIDDKVLCVPLHDPAWNTLEQLDDLSKALRDEIAHFFSVYKDLEQKKVKVDGWYSREDALEEIEAARERYRQNGEGADVQRLKNLRNFAIVALVALAIALAPGGGTGLNVVLWLLTVAFFASIAFLGYRLYMEHRFTLDSLPTDQRWVLYGSIGLAFWAFAAAPRLWPLGAGGIAAWVAILALASAGVYWVWRRSREYG